MTPHAAKEKNKSTPFTIGEQIEMCVLCVNLTATASCGRCLRLKHCPMLHLRLRLKHCQMLHLHLCLRLAHHRCLRLEQTA